MSQPGSFLLPEKGGRGMPRKADPDRIKAFEIYKKHQGKIELVEIAKKLSRPPGTIRGWKNKDKWEERLNGTLHKNAERSKPKERKVPRKSEKRILEELEAADLTEKQRLFCLYYIKNFNATMAAIKAGYSPDSAYQIGYENLRKPEIAKEIRRLKGAIQSELFVDAMDVLERYIKIAFADMTDFVEFRQEEVPVMGPFGPLEDKDGNPITKLVNVVKFKDSVQVDGGLICQIKQGRDGASIKLEDRQKALDKLAQYFDLFPDKFQRKVEEEKLKIAQQKLDLEKLKADAGDDGKGTDDGFMDALRGTVKEVWADEGE
jgi:phage terminase small subunit